MEHFYSNIQGWHKATDLYTNMVNHCFASDDQPAIFVEVGAWKGQSAAHMAVEIINSNKNIKFYCFDTWAGSTEHKLDPRYSHDLPSLYQQFQNNIAPVKNYIKYARLASTDAVHLFEDDSIDFVYIDANHEFDDVVKDIKAWWPKIKLGGLLAGDDFDNPSVGNAVSYIAPIISPKLSFTKHSGPVWLMHKSNK